MIPLPYGPLTNNHIGLIINNFEERIISYEAFIEETESTVYTQSQIIHKLQKHIHVLEEKYKELALNTERIRCWAIKRTGKLGTCISTNKNAIDELAKGIEELKISKK